MSKKPYDFLLLEKEPFQYVEKARVVLKDGFLTALKGKDGTHIISPSALMILLLGSGTSISQEAAIYCAEHDLQLCFVRGGMNIHSLWMSGRYQNPVPLQNQIKKINNRKLEYAKMLLIYRFYLLDMLSEEIRKEINACNNIIEVTLYEARWAKNIYRDYSNKYKVQFTRKTDPSQANDYINERLNILNNMLYSIMTSICIATHLSTSIAIIHGNTRRGGLVFDLADLIKTQIIFDLAFDNKPITTQMLMHKFAAKLKENNQQHLKLILNICLAIGDEDDEKLNKILEVKE